MTHTLRSLVTAYRIDYRARLAARSIKAYDHYLAPWRTEDAGNSVDTAEVWRRAEAFKSPSTRNMFLRITIGFFRWCHDQRFIDQVPHIKLPKIKSSGGWGTWTRGEVVRMREGASPPCARAAHFGYRTGQRLQDCLAARWDDVTEDGIRFVQHKTGRRLLVPIHPELKEDMLTWPRGDVILTDERGEPWNYNSFRQRFTREARRLGITKPFHGLRKRASSSLIEDGCSPYEAQSITGHRSIRTFEGYIRDRDQEQLARNAMEKWA